MSCSPVQVYDAALTGDGRGPCLVRRRDGTARPLPVQRWAGDADRIDRAVSARCDGPTLDVGCGPGRLAAAVAGRGQAVLGIDVSTAAIRLTRRRGVAALHRSVFDRLPGEGRWAVLLLVDGNVGIGGDPLTLLRRARALLAPGGLLVCEVEPSHRPSERGEVRLEHAGRRSAWFPWAWVGADDIEALGERAGLRTTAVQERGGRCFAELVPR